MATIDIWIQLENRAWDVCPSLPVDRMTSAGSLPVGPLKQVNLRSPVTGVSRVELVNRPIQGDALILRRYTANWARPDDRKVNPWDLNEFDPTDAGTMGTIPGPTIECNVGDTLRIHFRNLDMRTTPAAPWERSAELIPAAKRTHSLHAHGVSFPAKHDGAYPLSPPDADQPIEASERPHWNGIGVTGTYKQGDRVPPAGSFTYTWQARGAASAGVWLYHDHSICHENTELGALGAIVVHNPADKQNEVEITPEQLPNGSWTGSPLIPKSTRIKEGAVGLLAEALQYFGPTPGNPNEPAKPKLQFGKVQFEVSLDTKWITAITVGTYRQPPDQALYILIFHELAGVGMCINGRQFLGNAPTLVAGAKTRMRFGIIGMGEAFHTFHIHGHRWIIPGPSGKTRAVIEQSAQVEPTSQFEDTKIFGPGNSFAFTLQEGNNLFRPDPPFGEWHMHCHVPMHMMHGMAGSLLVIQGGELAMQLPEGQGCPPDPNLEPPPPPLPKRYEPVTHEVIISEGRHHFDPGTVSVFVGDTVRWINKGAERHSVTFDKGNWGSSPLDPGQTYGVKFTKPADHWYHCDFHPAGEPAFAFGRVWVDPAPTPTAPASSSPSTPSPAAGGGTTHDVAIGSTGFSPSSLSIKKGDSIRWTNKDTTPHTATADDHSWGSPVMTGGKDFTRSFPTAGTIGYHCHIHHEMTATVVVT